MPLPGARSNGTEGPRPVAGGRRYKGGAVSRTYLRMTCGQIGLDNSFPDIWIGGWLQFCPGDPIGRHRELAIAAKVIEVGYVHSAEPHTRSAIIESDDSSQFRKRT